MEGRAEANAAAQQRAYKTALELEAEVASYLPTGASATVTMLNRMGVEGRPRSAGRSPSSAPPKPSLTAVQAATVAANRQREREEKEARERFVADPDVATPVLQLLCEQGETVPSDDPNVRARQKELARGQENLKALMRARELAREATSEDAGSSNSPRKSPGEPPSGSNAARAAARLAMAAPPPPPPPRGPGEDVMRIAAANVEAMDIEAIEPGLTKAIASGAFELAKLTLAHGAAVLPAIAAASILAKTWDPSLNGQSKEFQEKLNLLINIGGGVGQTGSIVYSRLFPTEEKPNAVADIGRGVMGIGLALSYLAAYFTKTTSNATTQAARLAPFPVIRDLLLICISKATNVDARNKDSLIDAAILSFGYGVMQDLAYQGSALTGSYGGASLAAQLATWPEAVKNISKATVFFGSVEMLNAGFTALASSKSAKIAPGEKLDDAEVEERLKGRHTLAWKDVLGKLKVDVKLQTPTTRLIADQFLGPAINNFNFFMIGINLTGAISNVSTMASDDSTVQTELQALLYAVLYGAFAIPFAMALMQNPEDRFKYAEGGWLGKKLFSASKPEDDAMERGEASPVQQTRQGSEEGDGSGEKDAAGKGKERAGDETSTGAAGLSASERRLAVQLGDTEWMSEQHFDNLTQILRERLEKHNRDLSQKVAFLDPAAMLTLLLLPRAETEDLRADLGAQMDSTYTFVPLNNRSDVDPAGSEGTHWGLLVVDRSQDIPTAHVYDSAGSGLVKRAREMAALFGVEPAQVSEMSMRQQENGYQCGDFALSAMENAILSLIRGGDAAPNLSDMPIPDRRGFVNNLESLNQQRIQQRAGLLAEFERLAPDGTREQLEEFAARVAERRTALGLGNLSESVQDRIAELPEQPGPR